MGTQTGRSSSRTWILAHIGVRQNVIAQRLGVAQARAVAKHQPACGRSTAMWSVIVFALEGADADIDHGDAGMPGLVR